MSDQQSFALRVVSWQLKHGRQSLPWQATGSAYKVWLSEVMLQQTQVATVMAYYARFLEAFPTVADLAHAPSDEVMKLWAGLGYYSRARNLHACAQQVVARFGGEFPSAVADLESLPGIGRSTAGAIASLAFGKPAAILDGNVKRVLARHFGVEGYPEQSAIKKSLWAIADAELSRDKPAVYNQGMMDLGAMVCLPRNPKCEQCPVMSTCKALQAGKVHLIPAPKPKKPRPSLYFLALLMTDSQGRILLQEQTAKGIWKQLWMVPSVELESEASYAEASLNSLLEAAGLSVDALSEVTRRELEHELETLSSQAWLVHELTHRRLHFKVLQVQADLGKSPVSDCFFQVEEKAVPKLLHKLLEKGLQSSLGFRSN